MTAAGDLTVTLERTATLRFDDGAPVRAASAIAPFEGGWLIAQDDGTHAAWWRDETITRLRLFPPIAGHDRFSEEAGTKRLKPDLEAACAVTADGAAGVLLLGSGSLPVRTRAALVLAAEQGAPRVVTADLADLYTRVSEALRVPADRRNLEGACVVGDRLRWFQRGDGRAGVPDASVDLDLPVLLAAIRGEAHVRDVTVTGVREYDLRGLGGRVPLGITDAVHLGAGRVLIAAAAEDTADPVADGPVEASALVVFDGEHRTGAALLPADADGSALKVEGLAVAGTADGALDLLAVVDTDDPERASPVLRLTVAGLD